jgi:hypothetical protein
LFRSALKRLIASDCLRFPLMLGLFRALCVAKPLYHDASSAACASRSRSRESRSYDEPPVMWGCWSAASEEAHQLMGDIFQLAHGLPLGP